MPPASPAPIGIPPTSLPVPSPDQWLVPQLAVVAQTDGTWFILRTRSRQEKALARDLAARSIRLFLPLVRVVRYYGKRKVRVASPLFPGYVFVMGTREDCFVADRTRRVAQILEVGDQARLHRELGSIAQALRVGDVLSACEPVARGMLVEVSSGPFKGVRGMVESHARDNRLILHVELIGKAAVLEIDRDLLRPL